MVNVNDKFVRGGYGIVLEGVDQTLKALKNLAPDLDKAMKKKFRAVGSEIIADAKTRVPDESPLSNWGTPPKDLEAWHAKYNKNGRVRHRPGGFPTYNSGNIRAGLKSTIGKPRDAKFGALLYIVNKDAAGAIYEVAGRRSSGKIGTGGPNMIQVLNDEENASRVIWAAYDARGRNRTQQELIAAVEEAEAELRRRFGDEGGFQKVEG